jgi:hypothetical protein
MHGSYMYKIIFSLDVFVCLCDIQHHVQCKQEPARPAVGDVFTQWRADPQSVPISGMSE